MIRKTWGHFYSGNFDLEYFLDNLYVHRKLFKEITDQKPKSILEVGCGTGLMSIFLSMLGYEITALEGDDKVIKKAKDLSKKFNGKVKFIKGDAFKLPFKTNEFDVAFHQGLLEHFSDEEIYRLIDEQLRVSKTVIFSVPNNNYPQKDFGNERLLSKDHWDNFLKKNYKLVNSYNYHPFMKSALKGRLNIRSRQTMYLAVVSK